MDILSSTSPMHGLPPANFDMVGNWLKLLMKDGSVMTFAQCYVSYGSLQLQGTSRY